MARRPITNPADRLVEALEAALEAARALKDAPRHQNSDEHFPEGLPLVGKNCVTASHFSGITLSKLRSLVRRGELPAQVQGQRIVVLRSDLANYLAESRNENKYEPRKRGHG